MSVTNIALMTIFGLLIGINFAISRIILKNDLFELRQKFLQVAIVWCLPLLGAALAYRISREPKAAAGGAYPETKPFGDDPYVGMSNSTTDYFHDGHHSPQEPLSIERLLRAERARSRTRTIGHNRPLAMALDSGRSVLLIEGARGLRVCVICRLFWAYLQLTAANASKHAVLRGVSFHVVAQASILNWHFAVYIKLGRTPKAISLST